MSSQIPESREAAGDGGRPSSGTLSRRVRLEGRCASKSDSQDHPPTPPRLLHQFMRLRDVGQGEAVRDLETCPSRGKGIAKSLGGRRLHIRREVIASQEEDAGALEK